MFSVSDEELVIKFKQLETRTDVAILLDIDEKSLRWILYVKRPENMYQTFKINKKSGGYRNISASTGALKEIQCKISYILNLVYKKKSCAYGFIKGRDCKLNASQHNKKNYILNIDLKDFFSQINFGRVRGMLLKQPYNLNSEVATVIAQLVCFEGVLPQGAPSSPIITNMICRPLDTQLIKLSKLYNVQYTRYADDMSFSCSKKEFPKEFAYFDKNNELTVGAKLLKLIESNGFRINEQKVFLNDKYARQEVTGLVVNKFPNLKREYIKSVRAQLHNCSKYGVYSQAKKFIKNSSYINRNIIELSLKDDDKSKEIICNWYKQVLSGKIRYIGNVRGKKNPYYLKYALEYNALFNEETFKLKDNCFDEVIDKNVYIIMREDGFWQGTGFFLEGYGLITNKHVTNDLSVTYEVFNDLKQIGTRLGSYNVKVEDEKIDYSIFDINNPMKSSLKLGDSSNLKIGDSITICGYPQYQEGNSIFIQSGVITSWKNNYFGSGLYTISARVIHGASGGPVFNCNNEVVGIIKGGVECCEEEDNSICGFIPINDVLKSIENEKVSVGTQT